MRLDRPPLLAGKVSLDAFDTESQWEAILPWEKDIEEIRQKNAIAKEQGGVESVARHHAKGRLTIRERIDSLLDGSSFREIGPGAGGAERGEDGRLQSFSPANFVLGFGKVDGLVSLAVRILPCAAVRPTRQGCARASIPKSWRCNI